MKVMLIVFGVLLLTAIIITSVYAYCQVDLSCMNNCVGSGYSYSQCRMYCQVCQ